MANARYTNLPSNDLNGPQSQSEKTKRLFNGYYDAEYTMSGTEWDIVNTFFKGISESDEAADAMSEAVIVTARDTGTDVTDLINELTKFDGVTLTQVLALYFNQTRRGTSLLGFSNNLTTSKYVARALKA